MSIAEAQPINLGETQPAWLRRLSRERATQPRVEIPALNRAIEIVRAQVNPELARRMRSVAEKVGFGRRQEALAVSDVPSLRAESEKPNVLRRLKGKLDSAYVTVTTEITQRRIDKKLIRMSKTGEVDPAFAKDLTLIVATIRKALKDADPVIQGYRNMIQDVAEAWLDRFDRPVLEFMFGDEVNRLREIATTGDLDCEQALGARAALQELYATALQALQEAGAVRPGEQVNLELLRSAALMSLLDIAVYKLEQLKELSDEQIARYATVLEYVAANQDLAALQGLVKAPTLLDKGSAGFLAQMKKLEAIVLEARGIATDQVRRRPVRTQVPGTGRQAPQAQHRAPQPPPDQGSGPERHRGRRRRQAEAVDPDSGRRIDEMEDADIPFDPDIHEPLTPRDRLQIINPKEAGRSLDQEIQVTGTLLRSQGIRVDIEIRNYNTSISRAKKIGEGLPENDPRVDAFNQYFAALRTRANLANGLLVFRWQYGRQAPDGWVEYPIVRTYFGQDADRLGTFYTTQESDILYILIHRSALLRPRLIRFWEQHLTSVLEGNLHEATGHIMNMLLYRSPSARAESLRTMQGGRPSTRMHLSFPSEAIKWFSGTTGPEEIAGLTFNTLIVGSIIARAHSADLDFFGFESGEIFLSYFLNRLLSTGTGGWLNFAFIDEPARFLRNTANYQTVDGHSALILQHSAGGDLEYTGIDANGHIRSTGRPVVNRGAFHQEQVNLPLSFDRAITWLESLDIGLTSATFGHLKFITETLLGQFRLRAKPVGSFAKMVEGRPIYRGWFEYFLQVAAEPLKKKSLRNFVLGLVIAGGLSVERIQRTLLMGPREAQAWRDLIRIITFRPILAAGLLWRSAQLVFRGLRGIDISEEAAKKLQESWVAVQERIATGAPELLKEYIQHGTLMGFETPPTVHKIVEQVIQQTTGVSGIEQINVVLEEGFEEVRAYFWYDPTTQQCNYAAAKEVADYSTQGCTYVADVFKKAIELVNAAQGK
ncbi:MAG: hypothetical protein ABIE03_05255 [Patescibacteria group bacterium]|nr:hypothetical protein [Patescibacteria group bacterium]